jgi:nucleotide-binding universal stress UspA family protein
MTYPSILVQLDASKAADARFALAQRLATQFGTRLNGLFTRLRPVPAAFGMLAGYGANIVAAIAFHGVNVVADALEGEHGVPVADRLRSRAATPGAGLIVMGCYGHSRPAASRARCSAR